MKYYIAYSDDVFHYGSIEEGQSFATGQPYKETFTDEQEWIDRINQLKGDGWYESQQA